MFDPGINTDPEWNMKFSIKQNYTEFIFDVVQVLYILYMVYCVTYQTSCNQRTAPPLHQQSRLLEQRNEFDHL